MKFKLDKALSLVAVGVIGVLQGAYAAPVYEIKNIEDFDLNGTLEGTRNGYGMAVNADNQSVGVSKGKKKLATSEEDDNGVIDIEDGIADAEKVTYSIDEPIKANNFTFTSDENGASGAWVPTFDSVNGTTPPDETDETIPATINSVDANYYDMNDAGIKIGSMTAPEQIVAYTGTTAGQDYWYYREFEERGFVKMATGSEVELLPPLTEYVKDSDTVNVGGYSVATAINATNLITGYAGTELSTSTQERLDSCISGDTYPVDICIQKEQYPDTNGFSNFQYQVRAYVWQLGVDGTISESKELPLGLSSTSDTVFTAQGLGVNAEGVVAGRSHVYRRDDIDKLASDSAYWTKNSDGNYEYHWIPMIDDRFSSIAYDINDSGIVVGSYRQYLESYVRDKFFYFDTNLETNPDREIVTPNDFNNTISDLSSKAKDINNKGQVVGFIETTHDKEKPRPKAGFLFDKSTSEFSNLNKLLTCESKGFVKNSDGNWVRNKVEVQDGTGVTLTYSSDIKVVEASSINEDGTIVGTAFIRKPLYKLDANGNLVIGDNGLPVFEVNGFGDPLTSFLPRMVVLQPNGAEADEAYINANNCEDDATGETEDYKRKGAASFAWLFVLPLLWFRRRFQ